MIEESDTLIADWLDRQGELGRDYADFLRVLADTFVSNSCRSRITKSKVIFVSGAPGTGKSTLSRFLKIYLEKIFKKSVLLLSLDDYYMSRLERLQLAESHHPLLRTRGVPGTHRVDRLISSIRRAFSKSSYRVPVFDKLSDDLLEEIHWNSVKPPYDLVVVEGWCLGCSPVHHLELNLPINELEAVEDPNAKWRNYVNQQLRTHYDELNRLADFGIYLSVPEIACSKRWRYQQEEMLSKKKGVKGMGIPEVERFIAHYHRWIQHMETCDKPKFDLQIGLDHQHKIRSIELSSEGQG